MMQRGADSLLANELERGAGPITWDSESLRGQGGRRVGGGPITRRS